jgi:hypothetical protein
MKRLLLTGVMLAVTGCGHTPSHLGVRLDEVGMSRSRIGPAPADVASRPFLPNSSTRVIQADVLGDEKPELLVEAPGGSGVEIRDQSGALIKMVTTPEYLTDFGAVPEAGAKKQRLVLYTYPNKQKGGTFRVLDGAFEQVATWDELPPPGRFGVWEWGGQPALFYLQGDALVVRSSSGARLQELRVPEGHMFRDVFVRTLADGRTAIVLSGSGYTPYHMVCVYEGTRLILQDVEDEHAFGLQSTDGGSGLGSGFKSGFVVTTRNSRWQYALR